MRFQKKYKLFHQQYNNKSIDIPTRILKFHRTKWNFLISKVKQTKRLGFFLYFDKKKKRKLLNLLNNLFFVKNQHYRHNILNVFLYIIQIYKFQ